MSRPEPRLVAYILSLDAVKALGVTQVYPLKIPQAGAGGSYPGIVYQVASDRPNDAADGICESHFYKVRVTCLARETTGVPGYQFIRQLAAAVDGDSGAGNGTATGVSGWKDSEGNVWHKDDSMDGMGTIMEGTDQFEAYAVDLFYSTAYAN